MENILSNTDIMSDTRLSSYILELDILADYCYNILNFNNLILFVDKLFLPRQTLDKKCFYFLSEYLPYSHCASANNGFDS